MNEVEIIQKLAALTVGKKIKDVVIPVLKQSKISRLLQTLSFSFYKPKKYHVFELHESVAGNTYRIAGVAVGLPDEILGNSLYEIALPLIHRHHADIVYIVATAITNSKAEPPQSLIDLLAWNLNYQELYEHLHDALNGAGLQAFINSTILVKGTDRILKPKTDPMDEEELIASHSEQ